MQKSVNGIQKKVNGIHKRDAGSISDLIQEL